MGKPVRIDRGWVRIAAWAVICLLIVGAAAGVGAWSIMNPPEAAEEPASDEAPPAAEVVVAKRATAQISVASQGEVRPLRRTGLSAEVSGKLVMVDAAFEAGETFEEGALLLQIDRADYEAAHANAVSALADADLAVELEEVRQGQALRDWEKLGQGKQPSDLVRRVPQLASARARVAAARAAVDKALRDLERTEIRVPYRCRIERTYVDFGAIVGPGAPLVDLVSLGAVDVRLPLSLEDYGYLQRDQEGRVSGAVKVRGWIGGKEQIWNGALVRSEEIVESTTRSINVVAEFGRTEAGAPPVGMFVKAEITGISVPDVVTVPRAAVRSGSQSLGPKHQVLLATAVEEVEVIEEDGNGRKRKRNRSEGTLKFQGIQILRTEADTVLVSGGLEDGDYIVVTAPGSPLAGQKVGVSIINEPGASPAEPEAAVLAP